VTPLRHFVTDRRRYGLSERELVIRATAAIGQHVDVIQIREPDLSDARLAALVRAVADAARGSSTRVLVNDRADLAVVAEAGGVHLKGNSASASRTRRLVPERFLIGRSVHSLAEAEAAAADGGCDYLMFGTIFPSAGKGPGHPVAGTAALRQVCRRVPLPVIAIGGINGQNAAQVIDAGATGFAAVGLFMC
jgi:thiamine-phosphate pyrophosphorylase